MRKRIAAMLALVAWCQAQPAIARDREYAASACSQVIQVAKVKGLDKLGDDELEHSLCLMSKIAGEAMTSKDVTVERLCMESVGLLVREFKRRWPDRQAGEVFKTC